MNIFPTPFSTNSWSEKDYLFTQQSAKRTLSTHHLPYSAHQRSCISAEIDSQ